MSDDKKEESQPSGIGQEPTVKIRAPNIKRVTFPLIGIAPLVQCAFSKKTQEAMADAQKKGSQQSKKERGKKAPKDFMAHYREAMHISTEGWHGHPSIAFKQALVSACRLTGVAMTLAKQALFVEDDGIDKASGVGLVRIHGEPKYFESPVRLRTSKTFDIRPRPMFEEWKCEVTIRYDADSFTADDVANLLLRAGLQGGIGEGRADSKDSCGMGWGHFEFDQAAENRETA